MNPLLSPNTQAILLLTAPMILGRGESKPGLLTPTEYGALVRHLQDIRRQPSDFLSPDADEVIEACKLIVEEDRLKRLLGRGFLLSQVVERWQSRSIWVVSRADPEYPRRLKARLRYKSPVLLYGCGEVDLLDRGGLAVVGSRHVDETLLDYAISIGGLAAQSGKSIISGGAKGIDRASMTGALEAGGYVCGVLADSLERAVMIRENRDHLRNGKLTLVSPYDPNAGFNAGNAMQRNKMIYALSDASLIVSSDLNKGGTWTGAVEQLDSLKLVTVYVRSTGETSVGLNALVKKGAQLWPNPDDALSMRELVELGARTQSEPTQDSFELSVTDKVVVASPQVHLQSPSNHDSSVRLTDLQMAQEQQEILSDYEGRSSKTNVNDIGPSGSELSLAEVQGSAPSELVFAAVRLSVQTILSNPKTDSEVATALDVTLTQAKLWLQKLVEEGVVEKSKKPVRYHLKATGLFK